MACKPNRLRSACALIHADSKDHTVSISSLIWVSPVCSWICKSLKLGYFSYPVCCCENTDQTLIKRRCGAWCSYHFTLNLFVSSADKLYKKFDKRYDMSGLIWIQIVWHSLIIFPNSLEIDQTERYTLTVINLLEWPDHCTLCSAAWGILLGVFKWILAILCDMWVQLNYGLIGVVSIK